MALLFILCFFAVLFPATKGHAEMADGTYEVDYQILHADSDSVSISNDYFEKPATLLIKDGETYIQFTLNNSQWVKELQTPSDTDFKNVEVLSEDEENSTRLVQFKAESDIAEPITLKMHILVESMDPVYDHRHTARMDLDLESSKLISEEVDIQTATDEQADEQSASEEEAATARTDNTEETADQAATSDQAAEQKDTTEQEKGTSWLIPAGIALVAIIVLLFIWRKVANKNK